MNLEQNIARAADLVRNADALIIHTGAGMGVDSGLPDFRGNDGFWKEYPVVKKLGLSFAEMANPHWFAERPELAWAFYGHRLNLYRQTQPHEGFYILKELLDCKPAGGFVFTSNVDGQFQKAGFSDKIIEEVHGSIHHFQCTTPCSSKIWNASAEIVTINSDTFEANMPLPVCPHCGALARPNILMFGDWSWLAARSDGQSLNYDNYLRQLKLQHSNTVIIEIGAGRAISTVRRKSESVTDFLGGTLIRINPRDFQIPERIKGIELPLGGLDGIRAIANLA
jgi:NAD-dependent SIR2 family protein deacetylase